MTIEESIEELEILKKNTFSYMSAHQAFTMAVETMRKYQQLEDFARWVAEEIIDEDMWEYNHSAFAEIVCRKLVKLGIMQESNGKYLYEEAEDGND